jgi:hypothetical protein
MPTARRPRTDSTPYTGTPAPDRRLASSFVRRPRSVAADGLRIGIVSAYAPSTASSALHAEVLTEGLQSPGMSIHIVRAGQPAGTPTGAAEIVYDLSTGLDADVEGAARVLNRFDLVLIEHDFGVYGGLDGDQVLQLLNLLCVPVVAVVHTVPTDPSAGERAVLVELSRSADALVTGGQDDREQLHRAYGASLVKVLVIDGHATVVRYRELIDVLLSRPRPA